MSHRSSLQSSIGLLLAGFLLAAVALATRAGQVPAAPGAPAAPVAAQDSGVTVEFLGHSHYRLTSPSG